MDPEFYRRDDVYQNTKGYGKTLNRLGMGIKMETLTNTKFSKNKNYIESTVAKLSKILEASTKGDLASSINHIDRAKYLNMDIMAEVLIYRNRMTINPEITSMVEAGEEPVMLETIDVMMNKEKYNKDKNMDNTTRELIRNRLIATFIRYYILIEENRKDYIDDTIQ